MLQEVVMGNPLSRVWSICVCLFPMKSLSVLAKMKFCTAPEVCSDSSSDLRDEVNIYMG